MTNKARSLLMDDLWNLEFLSLVAKITQEIDNHTGLNDKTLAEFVINLHDQSKTLPEFKQKLKDVGAEFPESFVENMDRLILNMHPKHKKKASNGDAADTNGEFTLGEAEKKRRMFPGLALTNQDKDPSLTKDALMKEVDDMMAQFEGVAKKAKPAPAHERSPKRRRTDWSPSPPRRRSPSPPRGRGFGDRRDDRGGRGGYRNNANLDDKPVLYKIYNGKITGMKDFGAFVQLEGIAGRAEGESLSNPFSNLLV
jgi:ATP-dependent RNA helicase DHX8/PRP22